ncbi:hypothetical protein AV530_010539 [Patagioenas fasciata monilis]|uniref:Uncharacterized protein n=1 Tax=Patagioenas fasciata monilis TaxID=372326 RepID=A0A1V4KF83_PATFA|nr:hypothetical protein AV530_010539 [Patagioenas fasciata monilis]
MQDSIPQRKGALQRPLGYPRTPETLIIYIHIRSLCNDTGEINCEQMDVVIGSLVTNMGSFLRITVIVLKWVLKKLHLLYAG